MYDGPPRAGNRGGQGDFRWDAVKQDEKYRENYLGHSVNAPAGRWQKNKDVHWYARDHGASDLEVAERQRREEMKRLKDAEEEALSVALGFAPNVKGGVDNSDIAVKKKTEKEKEIERLEEEEKKREKELRKEHRALRRAEREVKRDERREEKDKEREERRTEKRARREGDDRSSSHRSYRSPRDRDESRDRHRDRQRSRREDRDDYSDREGRNERHDRRVKHEEGEVRNGHGGTRRETSRDRYRHRSRSVEEGRRRRDESPPRRDDGARRPRSRSRSPAVKHERDR